VLGTSVGVEQRLRNGPSTYEQYRYGSGCGRIVSNGNIEGVGGRYLPGGICGTAISHRGVVSTKGLRSVGSANCDMVTWQAMGYYKSLRTERSGRAGVGGIRERSRKGEPRMRQEESNDGTVTW